MTIGRCGCCSKRGVFSFNALFQGEIFVVEGEGQPQSIEPGDANAEVSTNSIEVLAPSEGLDVLSALDVKSTVVTPNGDGRNDTFELAYSLLGVQASQVVFAIYDLRGRKVHTLLADSRSEGRYVEEWDGWGRGSGTRSSGPVSRPTFRRDGRGCLHAYAHYCGGLLNACEDVSCKNSLRFTFCSSPSCV